MHIPSYPHDSKRAALDSLSPVMADPAFRNAGAVKKLGHKRGGTPAFHPWRR